MYKSACVSVCVRVCVRSMHVYTIYVPFIYNFKPLDIYSNVYYAD